MNRADQGKQTQDLDKGRGWLERAEAALEAWEASVSPTSPELLQRPEFAQAAAAIGRGYVQLAAVGRLDELLQRDLSLQEQDELRRRRAAEEARLHDGEPLRCGIEGCTRRALSSGRCGLLAHAVPPSECGCGGPLAHDSLDPRCAYFAGREADRG